MKKTVSPKVVKKGTIKVVRSSYSPRKAEIEEVVKLPRKLGGASFDDIVEAVLRPVDLVWTDKSK